MDFVIVNGADEASIGYTLFVLFTFDDVTPVQELHYSPEVIRCFVDDIRHYQIMIERIESHLDRDVADEEHDLLAELDDRADTERMDELERRIELAQDWLKHFQRHGIDDVAQTFPEFETLRFQVYQDLEQYMLRAEIHSRVRPTLFGQLVEKGELIDGSFHDLLHIYGLLNAPDEIAAIALHDENPASGPDCYHRPGMDLVGAWTKKQIGDLIFAVLQDLKNPAFLMKCLRPWGRGVLQDVIR